MHVRDANSLVITEVQSRVSPVFHKVFYCSVLLFLPNVLQILYRHNIPQNRVADLSDPHHFLQLVENSAPFLFPCTIEFSLICAAVLFIMWRHVTTEHEVCHFAFSISFNNLTQVYKLAKLRGVKGFQPPASCQRFCLKSFLFMTNRSGTV